MTAWQARIGENKREEPKETSEWYSRRGGSVDGKTVKHTLVVAVEI